jgi:hypothetical protein
MKQFKQDHPNASETDLRCQYAKEAHHIATILNATGEDYIDAVKLLIKLKKSSDKE